MSERLEIRPEAAFFEGHFPGQPILPGVTLFHLALQAIERSRGAPVGLRGIPHARLRRPVAPGEALSLSVRELAGERLRVELTRGEERIADGELHLGLPEDLPAPALPEQGRARRGDLAAPPLDRLLPQHPPMRFVTGLRQEHAGGLTCAVLVPSQCALARDGLAPALAMVEAAAQSAAAWEALRRAREGGAPGPRAGYLVALRHVVFHARSIAADQPALATIRLEAVALPLTHYRFEVSTGGRMVAAGGIATYLATP